MKTKEEIEQLAEKKYREYPNNPIDKEDWYYNKDNNCHRKRKAFVKGYTQCQEDNADKKYTEDDIYMALEFGRGYSFMTDKQFIESLNKQD